MLLTYIRKAGGQHEYPRKYGFTDKRDKKKKKMSQSELAEKVGYKDKTAIAKVEAGKVDLPQSKISSFAKALDTTTSYLFSDEQIEKPTTIAAHFDGDEYTPEELDEIKAFAEFVKSKRYYSQNN